MRKPIFKSRPGEPNPARFNDGRRYNDFIVYTEAYSNAYLVETADGNVLLNTGMGLESPVIEANLREFNKKPIHTLILTQGHVDHIGGVQFFRDRNPGLKVIASDQNAEHLAYEERTVGFRSKRSAFAFTEKFADAFAHYAEHGLTEFPAQDVPTPDVLVEDRLSFELGGIEFEVIAVPGAETNDSLVVWLPQHRICFTGNLFGCLFGHFPNLVTIRGDRYRDPLVVANAVDLVRKLEPDVILYGHHGPVEGKDLIREELDALYNAIHYVHDEVVRRMNAGETVHQAMADIAIPPEMEVGQGYGKVAWGVRAIWELYGGWFHHGSTTELYAVPQSAISGDLVELAGGADALVQRAREKFEHGKCEEAIHLLDIIRNASADNEASRKLYVNVHQTLLAESENFWLSSWLKNQIYLAENPDKSNKSLPI